MSEAPAKSSLGVRLLLILLPLWLVGSGGAALWYYFHKEKKDAAIEQQRFAKAVSIPTLADDLRKFITVIGERNSSSETAAANLSGTASMVEGTLGPTNAGFAVTRIQGPGKWPLLQITIRGKSPDAPPVWVVTSYDSPQGSPGAENNATGLASTLAAVQAMANDTPAVPIHFLFLPHANDLDSPVVETANRFRERVGKPPEIVLCVEAMGGGESLWISSRDATSVAFQRLQGLGEVHGADDVCLGEDVDLSSVLFELDLPAVRVSTRAVVSADNPGAAMPAAATVAASTGRLIELIRRCAK